MREDQVIIEPVLSEKTNIARDLKCKKYTFRVDPRANKFDIAKAVVKLFKVRPVSVNVLNVKGKPKFSRGKGGQIKGMTRNWKKAVVTLAEGDVISVFEGV